MSVERAKRVLKIEADTICCLMDKIDENFERAVELIYHCRGKVVVMGVGKSGIIAKKIASTLASTGTPAFFLHPVEGMHGDLGMLAKEDIVVILSNSGETDEISRILPLLNRKASEVMTRKPKRIERDSLAARAVQKMEEYSITSLFVFNSGEDKTPVGIIHLHDLLKAGVI